VIGMHIHTLRINLNEHPIVSYIVFTQNLVLGAFSNCWLLKISPEILSSLLKLVADTRLPTTFFIII
jgi:hypothetical protein